MAYVDFCQFVVSGACHDVVFYEQRVIFPLKFEKGGSFLDQNVVTPHELP